MLAAQAEGVSAESDGASSHTEPGEAEGVPSEKSAEAAVEPSRD